MRKSDTWIGIIITLFSVIAIIYTQLQGFRSQIGLSPGAFPTFVFIVMGFCGIMITVSSLKGKGMVKAPDFDWKRVGIVLASIFIYVYIMEYIGFLISTIFFMVGMMYLFGERRKKILAIVSVATSAIVYLVFINIFNIPLP